MNELQLDIGLGKALAILNFFLLFFLLGGSSVGLGASYRGAFAPKNHLVQGQLHIASHVRLGNRTVIS